MWRGVCTVTAMTYNVGNGLAQPARLAALLRAVGPQLVGLQELEVAQAGAIARDLANDYPYQVLAPDGFAGKGLLSQFPLLRHRLLQLYPSRPDLLAVVDVAGMSLTVIVAHLPPPRLHHTGLRFDRGALAQLETVARVAMTNAPALLLCDLNMTARHPLYARLSRHGLRDAFRTAGSGRGWTLPVRAGPSSRLNHHLTWLRLPPVARRLHLVYRAAGGAGCVGGTGCGIRSPAGGGTIHPARLMIMSSYAGSYRGTRQQPGRRVAGVGDHGAHHEPCWSPADATT